MCMRVSVSVLCWCVCVHACECVYLNWCTYSTVYMQCRCAHVCSKYVHVQVQACTSTYYTVHVHVHVHVLVECRAMWGSPDRAVFQPQTNTLIILELALLGGGWGWA